MPARSADLLQDPPPSLGIVRQPQALGDRRRQVVAAVEIEVVPDELAVRGLGQPVDVKIEGPVVPIRVEQARPDVGAQGRFARSAAAAAAARAMTTWRTSIERSATGSPSAGLDEGVNIDRCSCRTSSWSRTPRCSRPEHHEVRSDVPERIAPT
jgi:hypothetical protein